MFALVPGGFRTRRRGPGASVGRQAGVRLAARGVIIEPDAAAPEGVKVVYAVATEVPAPAEVYDAVHAELVRRTVGPVEGLLVHLGRATKDGFEVIEVWESRESFERYTEYVNTVMAEILGDDGTAGAPVPESVDLRGLLIPAAGIVR